MKNGYAQSPREIAFNEESAAWKALTKEGKLVLMAIVHGITYKETEVLVDGEIKIIEPGQWLTSIKKIKEMCGSGISEQNIRTAIGVLKKCKILTDELTKGNKRIISLNKDIFYFLGDKVTKELTKTSQSPNNIQESNKVNNNTKRKNKQKEKEAEEIYYHYLDKIKSANSHPKQQSIKNILNLLKKGEPKNKLIFAIEKYSTTDDYKDGWGYKCSNFFGKAEYWKEYTKDFDTPFGGYSEEKYKALRKKYTDLEIRMM